MVGYSKQLVRWRSGARRYAQGLYGNLYLRSAGVRNKNEKKTTQKPPWGPDVFFIIFTNYYYIPVCVILLVFFFVLDETETGLTKFDAVGIIISWA